MQACLLAILLATADGEPVALRIESFPVAPVHYPSIVVRVKNLSNSTYQGIIRIETPDGWQVEPAERPIELAVGETSPVRFAVKRGSIVEKNAYRLTATAIGGSMTVRHTQNVVTASAPYFKPTIDGDPSDWKDAIRVTFPTKGKQTSIGTYWNRRRFSILVAVEEDRLASGDAVQIAISGKDARTGTSPNDASARYEFLLVAADTRPLGTCYQLAAPGMKLAETQTVRKLAPLEYDDAELTVTRSEGITYYECSLPFRPMSEQIRPGEGREFQLSILVHDPSGTGIRDWGTAAGLWPDQRNRLAWSLWPDAKWPEKPPFDSKTPWGLCSSKY